MDRFNFIQICVQNLAHEHVVRQNLVCIKRLVLLTTAVGQAKGGVRRAFPAIQIPLGSRAGARGRQPNQEIYVIRAEHGTESACIL